MQIAMQTLFPLGAQHCHQEFVGNIDMLEQILLYMLHNQVSKIAHYNPSYTIFYTRGALFVASETYEVCSYDFLKIYQLQYIQVNLTD